MKLLTHEIPTPWGKIATVVDVTDIPTVVAAGFKPLSKLIKQLPDQFDGQKFKSDNKLAGVTGDDLQVMQLGSEFRQSCWKALRKVKAGKTITYAQLAHKAGNINAVRAAGSACAKNLIAPFVPCHRVIKTGGTIGNYAFGVTLKEALLTHEGFHNLR